ncbi:TIGR03118 family protein [Paracidovorax cattleyae]|uniref:TIGR03118 family protein n=1 Tax=Paracidovorax cattleyae TaxID=80868 RepID=A0A1H0JYU9_9BURK|nr:TIGR03118 family protein [Paracidovorax cattleyae]AVS73696.1 TIGR03118 family protein [Paracidovorax cattleyae]MBF9266105.1 TIGR03118 family protein [Paracidovorax cattleyae]SDO48673.1 TIGR03118 family protein [Paracidovorax cattleyae]
MKISRHLLGLAPAAALFLAACGGGSSPTPSVATAFTARTVVSDGSVPSTQTDPNLKNGWGIAFNPQGFVWVTATATQKSTLYDGNGVPQSLVVTVPPAGSVPANPTGIVFSGSSDFQVTKGGVTGPSRFIFSSEDGSIAGWSPAADLSNAIVTYSDGAGGAVYKGLAIAANGNANFLYATDFRNRKVDVFDGSFRKVRLASDFSDPQLPADYAPYGIQAIGSRIVVTYARQDASGRNAVHASATGAVNLFNTDGTLAQRLLQPGAPLNAPWGVALAPANFGGASGQLLIANEGDGTIGAFDMATGVTKGVLAQGDGTVLRVDGLRGIAFGNGLNQQPLNTLFYIAGPNQGANGAYGRVDPQN